MNSILKNDFIKVKNIYKLSDRDILKYKKQLTNKILKMKKIIKFQLYNMYANFFVGSVCAIETILAEEESIYYTCGFASLATLFIALYECLNTTDMNKKYKNYKNHLDNVKEEIKYRGLKRY